MKYLFDTNILIEAKNGFYAFDICPGFWRWLEAFEEMQSIEMVKAELLQGDDDLSKWGLELPKVYFLEENERIQRRYGEIANYVNSLPDFKRSVKDAFLGCADGWLIAAAWENDVMIMTHESFNPDIKRKIQLPNIAHAFNVSCLRITDVLRRENVSFILA